MVIAGRAKLGERAQRYAARMVKVWSRLSSRAERGFVLETSFEDAAQSAPPRC